MLLLSVYMAGILRAFGKMFEVGLSGSLYYGNWKLSVSRPIDDMSLSYADVVSEPVMVRDGVLAFTDYHFSGANACSFIEFLCTVLSFDVFSKCTSSMNK